MTNYLEVPWFVVPEDMIGGCAIATVDKPTSELNPLLGCEIVLTDIISEEAARHIVDLHNASLLPWDHPHHFSDPAP